jgi:hypothetical protein
VKSFQHRHQSWWVWGITAFEGLLSVIALLRLPSEPGAAFLLGYSKTRLLIAALSGVGVILAAVFTWASLQIPAWWRRLAASVDHWLSSDLNISTFYITLCTLFLAIFALLALSISPAAREIVLLKSLLERIGWLMVWVELAIVQLGVFAWVNGYRHRFSLLSIGILLCLASLIYAVSLRTYATATWYTRLNHFENYIYVPAIFLTAWGVLQYFFQKRAWYPRLHKILFVVAIGVAAYILYRHTAQWMDNQNTPSKAYWNLLADAFLKGQLYLTNPGTTHDLTFYNGHWFVPNPPLPVFFVLPLVAIYGLETFNSVNFSIFFAAINVALIYLLLQEASAAGLIPTGKRANLWLTVVFAVGSDYGWLALAGGMWFVSQVLTTLFITLAALLAVKKTSPWWIGICLGLAMLARPNVFTVWPLFVGIFLYYDQQKNGAFNWRRVLKWAVPSALPEVLAVAGLLYYNFIRFGNFLDFGYVTITSADFITQAVQKYGMFNIHFLPINLQVMFLKMPSFLVKNGCLIYYPSHEGLSIIAMTPAVIYIFRRFKANWWNYGAWTAVILTAGLLLLYSNYGSWQLGYRYLMDFIVPVLLLMAQGIGSRPSAWFKGLAILGVVGNAAGMLWVFGQWFC